jgi:hypothetical protein
MNFGSIYFLAGGMLNAQTNIRAGIAGGPDRRKSRLQRKNHAV